MAKRLFFSNPTLTAQAYATILTDNTHMTLIGGTTTQMTDVLEVLVSGRDVSSVVCATQLCRSTGTIAATPTALAAPTSDGPMVPATAALTAAVVVAVAFT